MHEAIDWMEKTTGRKWDDAKMLEAISNEWQSMVLWAKICNLQKTIPAPLDLRQLWSLRLPAVTLRHRKECVDYLRDLLSEVEDRVANGISARGFEKKRLMIEGIPPLFYTPVLMRMPEAYGAIFVGGEMCFDSFGAWKISEDGTRQPAKTLQESGLRLKTREDGVRAIAELYLGNSPLIPYIDYEVREKDILRRAIDWHCDGVILHEDKGCTVNYYGTRQYGKVLREAEIPTMTFEGSNTDPRDLNVRQLDETMESFMNTLGLSRTKSV